MPLRDRILVRGENSNAAAAEFISERVSYIHAVP